MCKSKLLLNDVPVFHGNLFKIRCGWVISGNKRLNFFRCFFLSYLSFSLIILLVVVLNAWWSACPEYRYFRFFSFRFLFVVVVFLLLLFFLFFYSFFYTFRLFATVAKITKADRPVNFTIFHCRISTNQPAWPVCTTSENWHTHCRHFCSCSAHKTMPSRRELDVTQHWSR